MSRRVLLVDDDPTVRTSLAEALADDGLTVTVASDGIGALAMIEKASPDVVLTDVRMPDLDGLALLRVLKERACQADVILMTAFDDMPTVVTAMREGAVEFLVKPLDLDDLRRVLARVFDDRRSRDSAKSGAVVPALDGVVGRTPAMINIYKLVGQAAATQATVLIRGESGTGKELIARAIHANSSNAGKPFVPVNCAALPSTLLESELFGHVKGAFTSAVNNRRGCFAVAGEGTVFLDEIGDTTPDFQSKLLRVLQDREYQPVGAEKAERTGARVIAATHQNLEVMISERRFREDLYYRLRVVEIDLPPLRDRRSDIPVLAQHMIHKAGTTLRATVPVLSDEAMQRLLSYDWPGNVRELENCLMRAVVLAAGNVIRGEHLSLSSPASRTAAGTQSGVLSLDDLEREHVVRVLAMTDGHKTRAADLLGISRPRLNRLIEKYGLQ
jgi:DNA-binding NtrC family response regulator